MGCLLISHKNISCIDFRFYIIKYFIVTISNDCITFGFKLFNVIHDKTAKESCTVFKRRFKNDYICAFCFDSFHYSLN